MRNIRISDATLCAREDYSFKEKIEIARLLEKLRVDVIELPLIRDGQGDVLLVKTLAPFVKDSVLSLAASADADGIALAASALETIAHPRIRIELPLSPVGMEYSFHKKPEKMLELIKESVKAACAACREVEFCAQDATRAEKEFLIEALRTAQEAGACCVTICDTAARLLPDDFASLACECAGSVSVPLGISCSDAQGLACAAAILAAKESASQVRTSVGGDEVSLDGFLSIIRNCGDNYGLCTGALYTQLFRTTSQISRIVNGGEGARTAVAPSESPQTGEIMLDKNDDRASVLACVEKLGYDLSEEDAVNVYEAFLRVADRKKVSAAELEAIVANSALQVPATYRLISFVINIGNTIASTAHVILEKDGVQYSGLCAGDGPVDAAFMAIDSILGHHYELDEFQIRAVTEGKDSMGEAIVKLRFAGKLYSGTGISTDIVGSSIRAYLSAINKVVYEEAQR